jgi:mannose-1-phosphate guanylyltransferase
MLVAVILSGGAGTRLWPVSREASPKPFMRIGGGPSLLQRTVARAKRAGADELIIVTNREYRFRTLEDVAQIPAASRPQRSTLLLEPAGRNTAPAVAAAALQAQRAHGDDAILLVLAADHLIQDEARFAERVALAQRLAADGALALFGIRPTMPDTGFGYIEAHDAEADAAAEGLRVKRFVEKPTAARAAEFLAAGNYYWNSGMFAFSAKSILDELRAHAPDVLAAVQAALPAAGGDALELDADAFAQAPNISIDYAVMEKSGRIAMVPGEFGWSDMGSWKAVADEFERDASGNSLSGDVIMADCAGTHAQSEDRLIAAVGLRDVVIVDTPDALLVCDKQATQKVKEVVAELQRRGHDAHKLHRTVMRPWGAYTTLHEGPRFKIKRIEVKPGGQLSSQMHHHRSEHWVVVSGTARVTISGESNLVSPNESRYVPVGSTHRLENPGKVPLVMIEVQCGDYVGEDDIVRFDDTYGRVQAKPITTTTKAA